MYKQFDMNTIITINIRTIVKCTTCDYEVSFLISTHSGLFLPYTLVLFYSPHRDKEITVVI